MRNINLYEKEKQELSKRRLVKSISGSLINGRRKILKEVISSFDVRHFFVMTTGFTEL